MNLLISRYLHVIVADTVCEERGRGGGDIILFTFRKLLIFSPLTFSLIVDCMGLRHTFIYSTSCWFQAHHPTKVCWDPEEVMFYIYIFGC